MNKEFKVGQRIWIKDMKEFGTIVEIKGDGYHSDLESGIDFSHFDNIHQTAHDMFKELGYEDKSYTTKGWFLIEKDFGSYIEEIRIDILTGDYKKSRIFPEDKMMWSGTLTKEEHLAIHQKLIELGWIE